MADETKTYLVNIESNIAQYAADAAQAKKEVEELAKANEELKESGASPEEIELSNAQLKAKNEEYRKAQNLLKTAISLTQSETGSRKALGEQLKLQEQALGKLGDAYIMDANGVRILNPLYVEQRKQIAATKQAIIDYDLSLNDGRSNIGRYGESVQKAFGDSTDIVVQFGSAVGGTVGDASSALSGFVSGPMGALKASVGLLTSLWKSAKENIDLYLESTDKVAAGLAGVQLDTEIARIDLRKRANGMIAEGFRIEQENLAKLSILKRGFFSEEEKLYFTELVKSGRAMQEQGRLMKEQITGIHERFEFERRINELLREQEVLSDKRLENETRWEGLEAELLRQREISKNTESTIAELQQAKINADVLSNQLLREKLDFNQQEYDNLFAISELTGKQEVNKKELNRLEKERNTIQKEYEADLIKADGIQAKINADQEKANKDKETALRLLEESVKLLQDEKDLINEIIRRGTERIDIEIEKYSKLRDLDTKHLKWNKDVQEQNTKNAKEAEESATRILAEEQRRRMAIINAGFAGAEAGANAIFEAKKNRLNAEMTAELSNANLTEAQKVEINKKYAKLQQKTDTTQAIINTALAIGNALATTKPFVPAGLIAGALAAVQGAAQVAVIKSQSFDGSGTISAPTSIISSPAVQRTFAQTEGATIFTQPQLTQSQLNALPNENILTAADIAEALKNIPAPIVTVEDINAKAASKTKVEVRATI